MHGLPRSDRACQQKHTPHSRACRVYNDIHSPHGISTRLRQTNSSSRLTATSKSSLAFHKSVNQHALHRSNLPPLRGFVCPAQDLRFELNARLTFHQQRHRRQASRPIRTLGSTSTPMVSWPRRRLGQPRTTTSRLPRRVYLQHQPARRPVDGPASLQSAIQHLGKSVLG